jgi:hypothetical protein
VLSREAMTENGIEEVNGSGEVASNSYVKTIKGEIKRKSGECKIISLGGLMIILTIL